MIEEKEFVDTLIISDIHLGSKVSRAHEALVMLKKYSCNRLILLGDIFDDLNFERLNTDHWAFISYIRELSNQNQKTEVVWVIGNHDELLMKVMSHLMQMEAHRFYEWEYLGKKYLAIHGHQFDRFLSENIILSAIASSLYFFIQRIDTKKQRVSRAIKRMSKSWLRLSEKIAKSASLFAVFRKAHYVFCGHTHQAMQKEFKKNKYYNSGCWTDIPSSYITILEEKIVIHDVI